MRPEINSILSRRGTDIDHEFSQRVGIAGVRLNDDIPADVMQAFELPADFCSAYLFIKRATTEIGRHLTKDDIIWSIMIYFILTTPEDVLFSYWKETGVIKCIKRHT